MLAAWVFELMQSRVTHPKLCAACFALCIALLNAHAVLTDPRQRGALRLENHMLPTIDATAPTDFQAHYPSGSKNGEPGSGTRSVMQAAGNNWTPYEPLDRFFHWRAGVCGDEKGAEPQEHLKGGKFYFDAFRVREYVQGSVIFMESEIVTHHNGFFEFHICNIDDCGDDISERCFHDGHCQKLMRTPGSCDSGTDMRCGPIDPMHPERWYLPCVTSEPVMIGGWRKTIAYTLPADLVCDHCVIQWYWVAHNYCNLKGVEEYFTSPHAPSWGDCPGQGGARGGWVSGKPDCGGEMFPEEYWQCADVRIVPKATPQPASPAHHAPPTTSSPGSISFTPSEISIPMAESGGSPSTSVGGFSPSSVQLGIGRGDTEEHPNQEDEGETQGHDGATSHIDGENERHEMEFISEGDDSDISHLHDDNDSTEDISPGTVSENEAGWHEDEPSNTESGVEMGARSVGDHTRDEGRSGKGTDDATAESDSSTPQAREHESDSSSETDDGDSQNVSESSFIEEGSEFSDSGPGESEGAGGALGIHHSQV